MEGKGLDGKNGGDEVVFIAGKGDALVAINVDAWLINGTRQCCRLPRGYKCWC
jgi:hypothetical protein